MKKYEFCIFSLLHISEKSEAINSKAKSKSVIFDYIANAVNLSNSVNFCGYNFCLLTNNKKYIEIILKESWSNVHINIEQIDFNTHVPEGIKFSSAHYKFDAFNYISRVAFKYVALIDLDIVMLRGGDLLENILRNRFPVSYDISDQVFPAYGFDVIASDIRKISPNVKDVRWFGGEYISGSPDFFLSLCQEIKLLLPIYFSLWQELHHQGDEMVVSTALSVMRERGDFIADGGTVGLICRYWSGIVQHTQKPFDKLASHCNFLHLPHDKRFLARVSFVPVVADRTNLVLARYKYLLIYCFFFNALKKFYKWISRKKLISWN